MGRPSIGRRAMTNAQRQRRFRKLHKQPKGRRSGKPLKDRGLYETVQPRAVSSLATHLPEGCRFVEPCAGSGFLVGHLVALGHVCVGASDITPLRDGIVQRDALTLTRADAPKGAMFITNPPHQPRRLLHALIVRLSDLAETWLLLDVNWLCIQELKPFSDRVRNIVPLGYRPKWFAGSPDSATQDFVWVKFSRPSKVPAKFLW